MGYPIEFRPDGRVRLGEPSDTWCAEEILARLPLSSSGLRWNPLFLAETTSTNDVAREQARRGAQAGFLVAATRQTRGRGRLGRAWESPPGQGLYLSMLLRPDWEVTRAGQLTILSSVAARDAVEALTSHQPQIKWPNDLFMNGRKLAGALIETAANDGRLAFAVVGLGINVRHNENDFSPEVRGLATSLYLATGRLFRRADLLLELLRAFDLRLAQPFEEVRQAWAESSLTLGQQVVLTTVRGEKRGQAMGLDESGGLLLRTESGQLEMITAGDMRAC